MLMPIQIDARTRELPFWITHYNYHRPHSATENLPPVSRLGGAVNNYEKLQLGNLLIQKLKQAA